MLCRERLKCPSGAYFARYGLYCVVMAMAAMVTDLVCCMIPGEGWILLLLRLPVDKLIQLIRTKTSRKAKYRYEYD